MPLSKIFISRDLATDSIFSKRLQGKATVIGLSLVEFQPLIFDAKKSGDWLFFYSKNGIQYYFSQMTSLEVGSVQASESSAKEKK